MVVLRGVRDGSEWSARSWIGALLAEYCKEEVADRMVENGLDTHGYTAGAGVIFRSVLWTMVVLTGTAWAAQTEAREGTIEFFISDANGQPLKSFRIQVRKADQPDVVIRELSAAGGSASGSASASLGALGARAGLVAWMVFALTNMPGEQPYLTVFWVIFGGMLLAESVPVPSSAAIATSNANWGQRAKWALAGVFLLASLGSLVYQGLSMQADRANYKLLMAKGRQDWPKTQKLAQAATSWYNPNDRVSVRDWASYRPPAFQTIGTGCGR